jgi:hypothetical protein
VLRHYNSVDEALGGRTVRRQAAGDNRPSICQNCSSALGGVRHGSRVIAPGPDAARRDCKMAMNIDLDEERVLLDTLAKVEALFADTGFPGERNAAANAIERIRDRLRRLQADDKQVEMRFSMPDVWSRKLFMALLRRYGIEPYRYSGQRRTTVMAALPKRFVDETLWPEFTQLNQALWHYLNAVTDRVIKTGIFADDSDAETRTAPEAIADLRDVAPQSKSK